MPVAPSEFPPPFDSADVIGPPTDPEDERIEVGVAIVGGGPAGLACANKVMQLLENEPELTEKLGEVPVAVIEKGKVAGRPPALRGEHEALGDGRAVPRPRQVGVAGLPGGHQGRGLPADPEESAPAEADAAELPQPRQLRHLGRQTGPLPRRQSRGGRRLHPLRDRRDQAAGRGPGRQGRALRRPRPRQGRPGARQLRARLRRRRQGHRPRRGHRRPPHLRRLRLLRHARRRPDALGARGQRGLGGDGAARPGHPHDGLAAAQGRPNTTSSAAASSTRWARTRSASAWSPASTTPTPPSASTTPCSCSRPTPSSRRSSRAASGSPGARRRSPPAATSRCPSASRCPAWWSPATPPAWSTCRP